MISTQTDRPVIALVGNPNTGKTSLFNRLTGLRARTANYPGITVDIRRGSTQIGNRTADVVDLPGMYSLEALSPEEQVANRFLTEGIGDDGVPDAVVLVLDATGIERNLFLAGQVLELNLPTVVALNLIDAARASEIRIDVDKLSKKLGCPVVPVSARTGEGLDELRQAIDRLIPGELPILQQPERQSCTVGCRGCQFAARFDWAEDIVRDTVQNTRESNERMSSIDRVLTHSVGGVLVFLVVMIGIFYLIFSLAGIPMDMVDSAFAWLGDQADRLLSAWEARQPPRVVHSVGAFLTSVAVFAGTYRVAGVRRSAKSVAWALAGSAAVAALPMEDFRSLVVDGVIGGIGGVVIFLPQICILFFLLSVLEDSGYMARAAFVMERLMRFVGLPGKAFVPMMSAHACAIPGIMAARVIETWRDRLVTILVLPLLTCSARLPVYSMVAALLFADEPEKAALLFVAAYLLGITAALFSAWCLKHTLLKGDAVPLVIELPAYRRPDLRNALATVLDRATLFLQQAGTVILLISVVLWALATFPKLPEAEVVRIQSEAAEAGLSDTETEHRIAQEGLARSFAGRVGQLAEPVFRPLGFDWKINVGVLTSFAAREVVVSTLAIVYGIGEESSEDTSTLVETLRRQKRPDGRPVFTMATGLSLLVFFVLAMQCLPTQAVTRRETGSWKWAFLQLGYMSALAWIASMITYQVCIAAGLG